MSGDAFLDHGLDVPGLEQAAVDLGQNGGLGFDVRDLIDHLGGLSN